jgi:hypothetical protein
VLVWPEIKQRTPAQGHKRPMLNQLSQLVVEESQILLHFASSNILVIPFTTFIDIPRSLM